MATPHRPGMTFRKTIDDAFKYQVYAETNIWRYHLQMIYLLNFRLKLHPEEYTYVVNQSKKFMIYISDK